MCVLRANKYFWLMGLEKLYRGVRSDRLQYPGDRIVYLLPIIHLSIKMARCYPGGCLARKHIGRCASLKNGDTRVDLLHLP